MTPSSLQSIKAPERHICLQGVSDGSICRNEPRCPFEALV